MAIPVILAEALTATEFFVAFRHAFSGTLRNVNRVIGIALGIYFTLIAGHLIINVIPSISWRGPIDIISVGFYVAGFAPLLSIALLELGIIEKTTLPRTSHGISYQPSHHVPYICPYCHDIRHAEPDTVGINT